MFSTKTTRYLAIAIPVLLALINFVPSNVFLSMATILAFFAYYICNQGSSDYHQWLLKTTLVATFCAVNTIPIVLFDAFYFFENPEVSAVARVLKALTDVTPFFTFFISIGYALYATIAIARLPQPTQKPNKK